MHTNIKNLPEGDYFTECGYSQSYVWAVIKRTKHTVTLARVNSIKDPDWKPDFTPGGFAGHCTNQNDQTWIFQHISKTNTKTIRMTKRGWTFKGTLFKEDLAHEFYDYNF